MIGHKNPQGLAPPRRSAGNASDREILGDWSNLKGTDYHLVYAIWLVLCAGVSEVAFYRGNDLLVRPIVPPPSPSVWPGTTRHAGSEGKR